MLLRSLPSVNLKEIASYLRSEDKCNLLLISKEFHQIFLPMVIELKFFLAIMIAIMPTISTIIYIKRFRQLSHLELVGLTFGKGEPKEIKNSSLCSIEKETSFDINLKLFYTKLNGINYLNVVKPCKKFFNLLLPYISNKARYLELRSDSKSSHLHSTILSKMSCVVQLTLTTNNANFKDIKHIETAQLNHLEYLNIHNLCSYKAGVLKISFDHMPNLQELILSKMSSIGFDGISNLKYLELNKTRLKNYIIDRKQFPKLVSILVKGHPCMSFRLLYSIFNLPNLTCLTLLSDSLTLPDYLLLDEIYPNKPSNLTKISINEFNISYTLIQFLQRLCKRLQHLNIADCHFDTISSLSLPLLNSKIGSFNNDYYLNQLEQVQVNNFCTFNDNDELSLNKFSESILSLAPNLRYSYYYLPKLKDQQAILKFHDVSHLKWYYGF